MDYDDCVVSFKKKDKKPKNYKKKIVRNEDVKKEQLKKDELQKEEKIKEELKIKEKNKIKEETNNLKQVGDMFEGCVLSNNEKSASIEIDCSLEEELSDFENQFM